MTIGQTITLSRPRVPWYSGYGANPRVELPVGSVGVVTHVDVPNVRGRGSYSVARFTHEGQSWQVSFGDREEA